MFNATLANPEVLTCGLLEHREGDDTRSVVSDGVEEGADLLDVRLLIPGWRVWGISAGKTICICLVFQEPVSPEIRFRLLRLRESTVPWLLIGW